MRYPQKLHLVALLCSILLSCREAPFEKTIVGDWKSLDISNAGDSVVDKMTFTDSNRWESETIVSGKAYNHTNGTYRITNLSKYLILRVDSIEEVMAIAEARSADDDSTIQSGHQENKMVRVDTSLKYEILGYDKDRFVLKVLNRNLVFRYRRLANK